VCFIDNEFSAELFAERAHLYQRRHVSVHTVKRLYCHYNAAPAHPIGPNKVLGLNQGLLEGFAVVVLEPKRLGTTHLDALANRVVHKVVVDDHVIRLRHTREKAEVAVIARIEQKGHIGLMDLREAFLEELVVGRIPSQQPRPARTQAVEVCGGSGRLLPELREHAL
jgi:hypothetical protein